MYCGGRRVRGLPQAAASPCTLVPLTCGICVACTCCRMGWSRRQVQGAQQVRRAGVTMQDETGISGRGSEKWCRLLMQQRWTAGGLYSVYTSAACAGGRHGGRAGCDRHQQADAGQQLRTRSAFAVAGGGGGLGLLRMEQARQEGPQHRAGRARKQAAPQLFPQLMAVCCLPCARRGAAAAGCWPRTAVPPAAPP